VTSLRDAPAAAGHGRRAWHSRNRCTWIWRSPSRARARCTATPARSTRSLSPADEALLSAGHARPHCGSACFGSGQDVRPPEDPATALIGRPTGGEKTHARIAVGECVSWRRRGTARPRRGRPDRVRGRRLL